MGSEEECEDVVQEEDVVLALLSQSSRALSKTYYETPNKRGKKAFKRARHWIHTYWTSGLTSGWALWTAAIIHCSRGVTPRVDGSMEDVSPKHCRRHCLPFGPRGSIGVKQYSWVPLEVRE